MQTSTLVKLATTLLSVLATLGGAALYLPDGKLKYWLVVGGMLGTAIPSAFAQAPRLYQTPAGTLLNASLLRPGDVLLYRPVGVFGLAIAIKTWHAISHVEVYVGGGESIASRDGLGTGVYPLRLTELAVVCRPTIEIDIAGARARFEKRPKRPYGWYDLLQFVGLDVRTAGIVCSPCATEVMRDAGMTRIFNGEPAVKIAPFQFEDDPEFDLFDVQADGTLKARA